MILNNDFHHPGLQICTLNVCGIKSKIDIPDFAVMCLNYDIMCLTETKTDDVDIPELSRKFDKIGFQLFASNRRKITNWRSRGVILVVHKNIIRKCTHIALSSDLGVCVKLHCKLLNYDKDVLLFAIYIPPFNTRYSSATLFDELAQVILHNNSENNHVVICGDLNAHTQDNEDFFQYKETDEMASNLGALGQLEKFNIPLQRNSTDAHRDYGNYGKALLELCKNLFLFIFNGRCGSDKNLGKATTVENSVIDYMIGSPFILCKVTHFQVHDFDPLLSDKHCLVDTILGAAVCDDADVDWKDCHLTPRNRQMDE